MDLGTRLSVPPQVMSRRVGDETVLLDLQSGLYFGVDQVGQRVWELAGDGRTLGEIVDAVVSEYEIGRGQAEVDVMEFAETLVRRGLLAE
jgi:hypothetical protein